jgi:hypothetical protein
MMRRVFLYVPLLKAQSLRTETTSIDKMEPTGREPKFTDIEHTCATRVLL